MDTSLPVFAHLHVQIHDEGVEHKHDDRKPVGLPGFMMFADSGRHPGVGQVLRHFAWLDEPEELQPIVGRLAETAIYMLSIITDGSELTAGLRKLLEAKDCFLRATKDGGASR